MDNHKKPKCKEQVCLAFAVSKRPVLQQHLSRVQGLHPLNLKHLIMTKGVYLPVTLHVQLELEPLSTPSPLTSQSW